MKIGDEVRVNSGFGLYGGRCQNCIGRMEAIYTKPSTSNLKGETMYDIYYAHHQWKYNTPVEAYELDLVKRYFPNAKIFNPAVDLKHTAADGEEAVMEECLETVRNSDIVIFSSLDGCVGTGVYHEIREASQNNKPIFYIYQDSLKTNAFVEERDDGGKTDRMFAFVEFY